MDLKTIVPTAKILVVDDEENNLIVAERLLRQAGYSNIHATTDSSQAIPLFESLSPDIVFLDLQMPAPNGFEILENLSRLRPANAPFAPVLVLTADITPGVKLKTLALGANDFLLKPFERGDLLLRTRNLLEARFLYLELAAQTQALAETRQRLEDSERICDRLTTQVATLGEYAESHH